MATEDRFTLTPVEVERRIVVLMEDLDRLNDELLVLANNAKEAEVSWKKAKATAGIMLRPQPGHGPGGRTTEGEVEDYVMNKHGDLFRTYKLAEGVYDATRDVIFTKRSQVDAYRTIAANLRAQT